METVVPENSPLAAYLEGKGEVEPDDESNAFAESTPPSTHSFAPFGFPSLSSKLPKPITPTILQIGLIARLRQLYTAASNSTRGSTDNERFLEHFRYTIIASQLLNEHVSTSSALPTFNNDIPPTSHSITPISTSVTGAAVTACAAFSLVWLLDWARTSRSGHFSLTRVCLVFLLFALTATGSYIYLRQQWIQYLRRQSIESASVLVANVQSFETTTSSVVSLIQEVELVSRGYRISTPLPPISRIEGKSQSRRCSRLRKTLRDAYAVAIPQFKSVADIIRPFSDEDSLERLLEVYDISVVDLREAALGVTAEDTEESESLKFLRVLQYRVGTLRRLVLCSLMSLSATATHADALRWKTAIEQMTQLSASLATLSRDINKVIQDEELFTPVSPAKQSPPRQQQQSAMHSRLQSQVKRIATLSTGIRSLQAKLHLLRDDSNRALSTSNTEPELKALSASLRDQYESLGTDLKTLCEAWEAGKIALTAEIARQERRVSQASTASGGYQSPLLSPTGLTTVSEDERPGTPTHALRSLNGDTRLPLTPPPTDDGEDTGGDEEVFEAIAAPRQRSTLSREQRIVKMQEERERQAALREKREANTSMLRELQSVINLRNPPKRDIGSRVMSM